MLIRATILEVLTNRYGMANPIQSGGGDIISWNYAENKTSRDTIFKLTKSSITNKSYTKNKFNVFVLCSSSARLLPRLGPFARDPIQFSI